MNIFVSIYLFNDFLNNCSLLHSSVHTYMCVGVGVGVWVCGCVGVSIGLFPFSKPS